MSDPAIIKPAWQSGDPDTGDPTKLGPTAWNAARVVDGGVLGDVLTRDPSSPTGAVWQTPPAAGARSSILMAFNFNTTTTPPPSGTQVRFNGATPDTTTAIYTTTTTNDSLDVYWVLVRVVAGMTYLLQDKNDHTIYAEFRVTGPAVDQAGYIELPVSWLAMGGVFLNNQAVLCLVQG